MTRTTEQWEALLDGITPGPWEVETSRIFPANEKNGDGGYIQEYWLHFDDYHDGIDCNSELIDHAPEAVAEVVRLRREIAAVRERYLARAAVAPAVPVFNDLADALTRILEGDSND